MHGVIEHASALAHMGLSVIDARTGLHRSSKGFASRFSQHQAQGLSSVLELGGMTLWWSAACKLCLTVSASPSVLAYVAKGFGS